MWREQLSMKEHLQNLEIKETMIQVYSISNWPSLSGKSRNSLRNWKPWRTEPGTSRRRDWAAQWQKLSTWSNNRSWRSTATRSERKAIKLNPWRLSSITTNPCRRNSKAEWPMSSEGARITSMTWKTKLRGSKNKWTNTKRKIKIFTAISRNSKLRTKGCLMKLRNSSPNSKRKSRIKTKLGRVSRNPTGSGPVNLRNKSEHSQPKTKSCPSMKSNWRRAKNRKHNLTNMSRRWN